jgi:DNA helicase-2/ATP-dependent DNA helicase PcrA
MPSVYSWGKAPVPSLDVPQFKAGDHVHHAQFGDGVVVSCQPVKDDREVVVAFTSGVGVKKLLLSFAKLEKIG